MSAELPAGLQEAISAACDANMRELSRLLSEHPDHRKAIAYEFLGAAIAWADMMGCDVEGFLRHLRATFDHPGVLVPPSKARA